MEQKRELTEEGKKKIKGSLVRKLRRIALILYFLELFFGLTMIVAAVYILGIVPDTLNSPFMYLTIFIVINALTDTKTKLVEIKPWYKSKWGWSIVILVMTLPLLFLSFLTAINLLIS